MAAVGNISADFLHGLKEHTRGRGVAPRRASGYDRSIYTINFPGMPYSWQDDPTGRNAIEKAEGNTVFPGLLSSNASVNLVDTQIDLEASAKLPDTDVALDVALEDDRQAILACAHAMHMGGCRAGGYNRLFQITSRASSPPPLHMQDARETWRPHKLNARIPSPPFSAIWILRLTRRRQGILMVNWLKTWLPTTSPRPLHVHVDSQFC